MLGTLLESSAPRQRRRASTAASIVIHAALIAVAVVATASAKPKPDRPVTRSETPPFYVPLPEPKRASNVAEPTMGSVSLPRLESVPALEEWSPKDLPEPTSKLLRDIDPGAPLSTDTLAPGGSLGRVGADPYGAARRSEPATVATVDRLAALLSKPRPRYPDQLRAAGVTGRVVVRLVVDTTGRVEPASVVVRESSHDLFTQAVRGVLPSLRFAPAELGGRKVRMLVDLPFEFRLDE
jgi:protein TonB